MSIVRLSSGLGPPGLGRLGSPSTHRKVPCGLHPPGRPGGFGRFGDRNRARSFHGLNFSVRCSELNFTPMEMIVMAFNDLKSGGLTGWCQSGRGI